MLTPGGFLCSPVRVLLLRSWQPLVFNALDLLLFPNFVAESVRIHPCKGVAGAAEGWEGCGSSHSFSDVKSISCAQAKFGSNYSSFRDPFLVKCEF